jgi:hypothetical protein
MEVKRFAEINGGRGDGLLKKLDLKGI